MATDGLASCLNPAVPVTIRMSLLRKQLIRSAANAPLWHRAKGRERPQLRRCRPFWHQVSADAFGGLLQRLTRDLGPRGHQHAPIVDTVST